MFFVFTVQVEVDRVQGKFTAKEEVAEQIMEAIESADPSEIDVDETNYEVTTWEVSEEEQTKPPTKTQTIAAIMPAIEVLTGKKDKAKAETFLALLEASGKRVV